MLVYVIATLWVRAGANLAYRLVIEQDLRPGTVSLQAQQFAIDGDFLAAVNLIARFGGLAIDADASLLQHRVYLASRADTLVGEILLYSFHRGIIQLPRIKARKSGDDT
jgi:hypothetical protein